MMVLFIFSIGQYIHSIKMKKTIIKILFINYYAQYIYFLPFFFPFYNLSTYIFIHYLILYISRYSIQNSMGKYLQDAIAGSSAFMWSAAIVTIFLLLVLTLYFIKWRGNGARILEVLMFLLVNCTCETIFETMSYINQQSNTLCIISLIGRLGFTVAANFWIIFITRLIYIEALAPGKFFDLVNFVSRNIIMTYIPSLVLCVFLLLMILIGDSKSQSECWKILTEFGLLDYIVYFTSFILPNLTALIIVLGYLYSYKKLVNSKWTHYLWFPTISIFFSLYYVAIKSFVFIAKDKNQVNYLQIPLLVQPILYSIIFIYISMKTIERQKNINSDLTIRESQIHESFIENL